MGESRITGEESKYCYTGRTDKGEGYFLSKTDVEGRSLG